MRIGFENKTAIENFPTKFFWIKNFWNKDLKKNLEIERVKKNEKNVKKPNRHQKYVTVNSEIVFSKTFLLKSKMTRLHIQPRARTFGDILEFGRLFFYHSRRLYEFYIVNNCVYVFLSNVRSPTCITISHMNLKNTFLH